MILRWQYHKILMASWEKISVLFYSIAILKSLSFILKQQYFVVFTSQIQCFDWLKCACFDSSLFSQPIKIDHHFKVKEVKRTLNNFGKFRVLKDLYFTPKCGICFSETLQCQSSISGMR